MFKLISKETGAFLMSLPIEKKVCFLLFLYERMVPELHSFCIAESLDFSVFQMAREEFWRSLTGDHRSIIWTELREAILDSTPDSEDFGSQEASYAINAALVAADIAGFLVDRQDIHVIEAMGYVLNSLGAYIIEKIGLFAYDRTISDLVNAHPLVQREARREESDVAFLSAMQDPPWSEDEFSLIQHRVKEQSGLFSI